MSRRFDPAPSTCARGRRRHSGSRRSSSSRLLDGPDQPVADPPPPPPTEEPAVARPARRAPSDWASRCSSRARSDPLDRARGGQPARALPRLARPRTGGYTFVPADPPYATEQLTLQPYGRASCSARPRARRRPARCARTRRGRAPPERGRRHRAGSIGGGYWIMDTGTRHRRLMRDAPRRRSTAR